MTACDAIQRRSSNSFSAARESGCVDDRTRSPAAKLLNNRNTGVGVRFTRLRYDAFVGPPMIGEKRIFGLVALALGLVAGVLILLDVQASRNVDLVTEIGRASCREKV